MSRLAETTLVDFTGGINLRSTGFQLRQNESPGMLNVHVDSRGGFFTRKGWKRWNPDNPVEGGWTPRSAFSHTCINNNFSVWVTHNNTIYRAGVDAEFEDLEIPCNATPHLADFTSWGVFTYMATGRSVADLPGGGPAKCTPLQPPVILTAAGNSVIVDAVATRTWNDDYTVPEGGVMPQAEVVAAHAGYLFVGNTKEDADLHPTRIRWSHPNDPEDWAELDFIDIQAGGNFITALISFQDHLLIFKESSVWALYGYDRDSWQLVRVSDAIGTPAPTAVTASPQAVLFYAPAGRGGIYGYTGREAPVEISEVLRGVFEQVSRVDDVFLGWAANRLIASVPWVASEELGSPVPGLEFDVSPDLATTTFSFDPAVGRGAWEAHRLAKGALGPVVQYADINHPTILVTHMGDGVNSAVMQLDVLAEATDEIDPQLYTPATVYVNDVGEVYVDTVEAEDTVYLQNDEFWTPVFTPFPAFYTTSWQMAETPELTKSWRRPRMVIRNPRADVEIRVESYRDYEETAASRSGTIVVPSGASAFWREDGAASPSGDGFDWDDGTMWGARVTGSQIVRGPSFGKARSLQLRFSTAPGFLGRYWGVDAIVLKHNNRRFTT